jgi:hypothetical protein
MKKITQGACILTLFFAVVTVNSCRKVDGCTNAMATNFSTKANIDNGTCQYILTFYTADNLGNISVTLSSSTTAYPVQIINQVYANGAIACGDLGCANYQLPIANYTYKASCPATGTSPAYNWSGGFTLGVNACNLVELGTTAVTFWADTTSYGNITVNLSGFGSASISGSFPSAPTCGSANCANFTVTSGDTLSYTASSTSGKHWAGTVITTTPDQCITNLLP